jgi:uncharacterized membrane protein
MKDQSTQLERLLQQLKTLEEKQQSFTQEIQSLRDEVNRLHQSATTAAAAAPAPAPPQPVSNFVRMEEPAEPTPAPQPTPVPKPTPEPVSFPTAPQKPKADWEKFVGENLISKIGIAITVLGVGIGAKYAIDHELISPLTRIILGYLMGAGLLAFALKLKAKYEPFSAVLLSGAMAIFYFITYAAFSFYNLLPQAAAFVLMALFTAFTVLASLKYNRQLIALFGLVGAYAVPFLLSDGSGRVAVLFSYMTIVNSGILIIAFRKYWQGVSIAAFTLSWLIYGSWFVAEYNASQHFTLALLFAGVFFALFYGVFIGYQLRNNRKLEAVDVFLLLANSFLFYGFGYAILDRTESTSSFTGLFTVANAVVHFVVSLLVYRRQLADRTLFYLVAGLVLVFITIAIPVQLNGHWVTLLWVGEAALLYWIGTSKQVAVYERLSYPLMALAFFSLLQDWASGTVVYVNGQAQTSTLPIFNFQFLTSVLFIAAFGFINYLRNRLQTATETTQKKPLAVIAGLLLPGILLFVIYYSLRLELEDYWNQRYAASEIKTKDPAGDWDTYQWNYDLVKFHILWLLQYSMFFVAALALVNHWKIRSRQLTTVCLILAAAALLAYLTYGLYSLSLLRDSYQDGVLRKYYQQGPFHIGIRYVSYFFAGLLLYSSYRFLIKPQPLSKQLQTVYELVVSGSLVWIASSELISNLDLAGHANQYKLGLSILWGVCALLLIGFGIWQKKKQIRIAAIVLFGATLLKLFFYDISHLNTISKTIVFVLLGVLLLIISFLYNKYKLFLSDDTQE